MGEATQPGGPGSRPASGRRTGLPPSSLFFLAVSAVLAVLAVLLATGVIGTSTPPPPPAEPGRVEQVHVVDALRAQGLGAEAEPRLFVPRGVLGQPGQGIRVEGEPLYAFFFGSPEEARAALAAAEPGEILPAPAGTPEALGSREGIAPFVVQGSNVVAAMAGGSEETRAKVRAAIEGLP